MRASPQPGVLAALSYIDRHFAKPVTVARLARVAGLSPAHFIRAFAGHVGATPHRHVRQRRLDRAAELLVTTPMPITEVAEAVGFRSLGSFSRIFHAHFAESPTAYRAARRRAARIPECFVRMYRADR